MVRVTPRCAAELGYVLSEEDKARAYIEVSGRKGFGVKADDLIDILISSAAKEVDSRHPELKPEERRKIAGQIATGALRDRKSTRSELQSPMYLVCRLLLEKKKLMSPDPSSQPLVLLSHASYGDCDMKKHSPCHEAVVGLAMWHVHLPVISIISPNIVMLV